MVHHARAQIGARGVESLSVNEVLRLSGGSKATLVKYFGGRDGLISAAIGEEARETIAALQLGTANLADGPLADGLSRLLEGVLRFYMLPASLTLYRAVVAMGAREPGTAAAFYDHGHRVVVDAVAQVLRAHCRRDQANAPDFADMADQIVHAIRAGLHERALLGLAPEAVSQSGIEDRIRRTVALLLPGVEAALRD